MALCVIPLHRNRAELDGIPLIVATYILDGWQCREMCISSASVSSAPKTHSLVHLFYYCGDTSDLILFVMEMHISDRFSKKFSVLHGAKCHCVSHYAHFRTKKIGVSFIITIATSHPPRFPAALSDTVPLLTATSLGVFFLQLTPRFAFCTGEANLLFIKQQRGVSNPGEAEEGGVDGERGGENHRNSFLMHQMETRGS